MQIPDDLHDRLLQERDRTPVPVGVIQPAGLNQPTARVPRSVERRRDQQEEGADREQQDPDAGVAAVEDGAPEEEASGHQDRRANQAARGHGLAHRERSRGPA